MDQEKIGEFIRTIRKEKGWTQEQLAERLGVSQRSVSRWETGKTMPDYALLPAICEALDVNAAELLNARRIDGEVVSKPDVTAAIRAVIALAVRKKGVRRLLGAVVSVMMTLALMIGLYAGEFSISVESTAELEHAINEYHFAQKVTADVLERQAAGSRLYVLYAERDCPGACGLACLEKGFFGKYRFIFCADSENRWISARAVTVGHRQYCVSYGVNELPGVEAYGVCGMIYKAGESVATEPPGAAVLEEYPGSPFLRVTEVDKNLVLWTQRIKYYAGEGEIPFAEMERRYGECRIEDAPHSITGTAERWLIYAFELIVLGLGAVFVRYFLTDSE